MARNIGKLKILLGDEYFNLMENKMKKQLTKKIDEEVASSIPRKVSKDKINDPNGKKQPERFKNIHNQPKKSPKINLNLEENEKKEHHK